MRRLEEDHGAAFGVEIREAGGPFAGLARQEPLEAEAVGGQPGERERGQHRGRAGRGGDGEPGGHGPFDQAEARVRDGRHAGVGHHHEGLAGPHLVQEFAGLGGLVVLVVADDPAGHGDAEVLDQAVQPPGVLGGDDVRRRQQFDQPGEASPTLPIGVAASTIRPGRRLGPAPTGAFAGTGTGAVLGGVRRAQVVAGQVRGGAEFGSTRPAYCWPGRAGRRTGGGHSRER